MNVRHELGYIFKQQMCAIYIASLRKKRFYFDRLFCAAAQNQMHAFDFNGE